MNTRFLIAIAVFLFSLALVSGTLAAVSRIEASLAATPDIETPGIPPQGDGPWVVRAYFDDPQMVARLAARLEPWEVNREQSYVVVEVNREQYLWLLWLGFKVQVDEKLTAQLNQPHVMAPGQVSGIPGYPCYRTVEETYASAVQIAVDYPQLAVWIDVYDSWEKKQPGGLPGYDLRVLRITNSSMPGPKPKLFVLSAIHAREYATAELNIRFAEHLVANYGQDPDITWLLDYNEIHLLLQSNPDGRKKAETGLTWWRKNTNSNYCSSSNSYLGADLNRNFEFSWGCCNGSSGDQCDEVYRGPSTASEPETQAIQNYLYAEFSDQRPDDLTTPAPIDASGVFMDIHSYSELVLWPWGFTSSIPPNGTQLQTLGRKFAYFNNYHPEQAIGLYPTDGTTDDFAYGRLGLASYTFELGTTFFQDCATFENTILPDNLDALLYAAKSARTPYMTPAGPDALNLAASPAAAALGYPVVLTANADDTRYNNQNGTEPTQNIAAAEYYIDVPPWSTNSAPIAHNMSASDGSFDEKIEAVEARVDTSGLSVGRHTIFVRGRDANNNWGPVSSAFLYVFDPDVSPVIEGYVRDYSNNSPLGASVSAGDFVTSSDTSSGFYSMPVISGTYDMAAQAFGFVDSTVPGVFAPDYSTVQQNFYLQPTCFSDDVESGNQGWTIQGTWAITDEVSHSPTYTWTDSPGMYYENDRDISLTSPVINLTGATGVELSFWHIYDIEDCPTPQVCDFGNVEYSLDGGNTWTLAASYSGENMFTWTQEVIPLFQLDGQANARIRFRLKTDLSINKDGWHIDDIQLYGSVSSCYTPFAPTADFTSSSPVLPGDLVRFTDQTQGTHPLSYFWDFGDGVGTSTRSDPFYTYSTSGTYQVTLTVTNSLGSDSITHPVVVNPCTSISVVTMTLQTTGTFQVSQPLDFLVDIGPDDANKPYNYLIDFGDGSQDAELSSDDPLALTHTYSQPGVFPIQFSAWNCGAQPVTDNLIVDISGEEGILITPTTASAVVPPGEIVTHTMRVTNTSKYSNSFDIGLSGNTWLSEASTATLGPLASNQGKDFTVRVQVPDNATGGQSDTVIVTVNSQLDGIIPASAELTTTAANMYSFNLLPSESSRIGLPGGNVTHVAVLTNTGNTTDTYTIEIANGWPVEFSVVPQENYKDGTITLDIGRGATLQSIVSIPADTSSGESDTVTITASSQGNSQLSEKVRMETVANAYIVRLPLIPAQFGN